VRDPSELVVVDKGVLDDFAFMDVELGAIFVSVASADVVFSAVAFSDVVFFGVVCTGVKEETVTRSVNIVSKLTSYRRLGV
jgi:hypothetical protein